jgi:hypothetical protein
MAHQVSLDVDAFRRMIHSRGTAYRHLAIELIKICRTFATIPGRDCRQYHELSRQLPRVMYSYLDLIVFSCQGVRTMR